MKTPSAENASHTPGANRYTEDDHFEDDAFVDKDPNAMDWEPISSYGKRNSPQTRSANDGTWLRQQRFFPPEEPTGLENLLMHTRLVDDDDVKKQQQLRRKSAAHVRWNWAWVYSLSIIPLLVLLSSLWWRGGLASEASEPASLQI